MPVAAAGLAPCLGDVALVRVVTKECGDRAAAVLERHLREKNVATWAARGVSSSTEGVTGEGAEGAAATAKMLGQVDALLDELALMTQHTESYDRFVRFLVEEVCIEAWGGVRGAEVFILEAVSSGLPYIFFLLSRSLASIRTIAPSGGFSYVHFGFICFGKLQYYIKLFWPLHGLLFFIHESQVENAHPSEEEGVMTEAVGVGGQPSVVPAPILEPIMPTRTRLQEAAAEVAMYYSQIEGQVTYDDYVTARNLAKAAPGRGCIDEI